MESNIKISLRPKTKLQNKLIARLKFSEILHLPEPAFAKLIAEIEKDPVFLQLTFPKDSGPRAVFRKRFPHTRIHQNFYEINEEIKSGDKAVDVERLLGNHKGVQELIQRIGKNSFENYFLYRESAYAPEEISKILNLNLEEVDRIQNFLLEFSIHSEFFCPTTLPQEPHHYTPIAKIEIEKNGEFFVSYLSPHLAAGRYVINRERLSELRKKMDLKDRKSMPELLKKLEWINLRQDTLQKIFKEILERQSLYFTAQDSSKLLSLTQRETARRIGVAPSTVSRAVSNKTIFLPWGEEKPLTEFFLNRKKAALLFLQKLINEFKVEPKKKISDNFLKEILNKRYRLKISRRTINLYRHELK
ncbi:MAG: hypothetical protein HYT97_06130 [Elusimicrobia bacterium]|nr:hypothetical protein [Elusimicrobiota bacterium]